MADEPHTVHAHRNDSPRSTVAIISYLLIGQFTLVAAGVFLIIFFNVKVEPTILTVLGGVITAAVAALTAVGGFWLAGMIGSKDDHAALRQLAGSGPPPPADPTNPPAVTEPVPPPRKGG